MADHPGSGRTHACSAVLTRIPISLRYSIRICGHTAGRTAARIHATRRRGPENNALLLPRFRSMPWPANGLLLPAPGIQRDNPNRQGARPWQKQRSARTRPAVVKHPPAPSIAALIAKERPDGQSWHACVVIRDARETCGVPSLLKGREMIRPLAAQAVRLAAAGSPGPAGAMRSCFPSLPETRQIAHSCQARAIAGTVGASRPIY